MDSQRRKDIHELADELRASESGYSRLGERGQAIVDCEAELTRMEQALEVSRKDVKELAEIVSRNFPCKALDGCRECDEYRPLVEGALARAKGEQ